MRQHGQEGGVSAIQEHHVSLDLLLQDWLGEADAATSAAIDAHLMGCDTCGELLDELAALDTAIRAAMQAGTVAIVVGPRFVELLAARRARIREYRLAPSSYVNCSVAPDDDVLVSRLQVQLQEVQRLDVTVELSTQPGVVHRLEDIPFDAAAGEVLMLPGVARVRQLPAHIMDVTLVAHGETGSREIARYQFRHTPWSNPRQE